MIDQEIFQKCFGYIDSLYVRLDEKEDTVSIEILERLKMCIKSIASDLAYDDNKLSIEEKRILFDNDKTV